MNAIVMAALGGIALAALLHPSDPHRALTVGKSYVATFKPPAGAELSSETLIHVRDILPEGSFLSPTDDGMLAVRFTAVSSAAMGDIPTPLGTFELKSLKEV